MKRNAALVVIAAVSATFVASIFVLARPGSGPGTDLWSDWRADPGVGGYLVWTEGGGLPGGVPGLGNVTGLLDVACLGTMWSVSCTVALTPLSRPIGLQQTRWYVNWERVGVGRAVSPWMQSVTFNSFAYGPKHTPIEVVAYLGNGWAVSADTEVMQDGWLVAPAFVISAGVAWGAVLSVSHSSPFTLEPARERRGDEDED